MSLFKKISFVLIIIVLHSNVSFARRTMTFKSMDFEETVDVSEIFKKMKFARVVNSPYKELNNKVARIVGTSDEVWESQSINNWAMYKYIETTPPAAGRVYYGKVDYIGYCFHESWLQELNEEEEKQFVENAKHISAQFPFREQ